MLFEFLPMLALRPPPFTLSVSPRIDGFVLPVVLCCVAKPRPTVPGTPIKLL